MALFRENFDLINRGLQFLELLFNLRKDSIWLIALAQLVLTIKLILLASDALVVSIREKLSLIELIEDGYEIKVPVTWEVRGTLVCFILN